MSFRDESISYDADWLINAVPASVGGILADTRWPQGAAASMQAARERGVPGVIDGEAPVMAAREALLAASHVAFSFQGLRDFTGQDDLHKGLREAYLQLGDWVCVTDGEHGVHIAHKDRLEHIPAFEVAAVDTLGAGDVWHGAFTLSLAEGTDARRAVRFANAVAAIKCMRFGGRNGTPDRAMVEAFLSEQAA